jgi:hypothetical protein
VDYHSITSKISHIFQRDHNSSKNGDYVVRSLYFDNKSNNDYYQKIDGVETRKKIRMRIYNYESDPVKLEIKSKFNKYIKKESLNIKHEDVDKIISGNYATLLDYDNHVAAKIYRYFQIDYYRPVAIIDYDREAYSFDLNQMRITFDKRLRKTETDIGNLFINKEMSEVLDAKKIIMEIKFNGTLPAWVKNILQLPRFERCAISKYTLSRYIEG